MRGGGAAPRASRLCLARAGALLAVLALALSARALGGARLAAAATLYPPDATFAPFARGAPPSPPTWGLNIVAFAARLAAPAARAPLEAAYGAWRAAAARELGAGAGALLYPFAALHVTATTPSPFTADAARGAWRAEDRAAFAAAWAGVLARARARGAPWPAAKFPLVFSAPRLARGGAGVIDVGDPTGGVAALRAALAAAAAGDGALGAIPRALRATAGEKTPSIVHATVMRLALPRAPGLSDAELEARWARAAAAWPGPVVVEADAARLLEGNELAALVGDAPEAAVLAEAPYAA